MKQIAWEILAAFAVFVMTACWVRFALMWSRARRWPRAEARLCHADGTVDPERF